MSNLHHVIVLFVSIHNIAHACNKQSDWPVADESRQYFRWLSNNTCFLQPYAGFANCLCITLAYLTMDTIAVSCIYPERSSIQYQTLVHHGLSISGFLATLIGGFGLPGISNASLICEISSLFLNYRHYFNNQDNGGGQYGLIN